MQHSQKTESVTSYFPQDLLNKLEPEKREQVITYNRNINENGPHTKQTIFYRRRLKEIFAPLVAAKEAKEKERDLWSTIVNELMILAYVDIKDNGGILIDNTPWNQATYADM